MQLRSFYPLSIFGGAHVRKNTLVMWRRHTCLAIIVLLGNQCALMKCTCRWGHMAGPQRVGQAQSITWLLSHLIAFLSQLNTLKLHLSASIFAWGSIQNQFLSIMLCLSASFHWPTLNLIFCAQAPSPASHSVPTTKQTLQSTILIATE